MINQKYKIFFVRGNVIKYLFEEGESYDVVANFIQEALINRLRRNGLLIKDIRPGDSVYIATKEIIHKVLKEAGTDLRAVEIERLVNERIHHNRGNGFIASILNKECDNKNSLWVKRDKGIYGIN